MRTTQARASRNGKPSLNVKLDELVREMIESGIRFPEAKREFEKRFLTSIMERERGNLSRAAKVLHIHRNTLSKKLAELNAGRPAVPRVS
ncbi:MAG TPA: helix-turn-helix domain-containing protein [Vicinamibacteria bacterium]|nr:helix-turn-helix domain-containing protein [Vicinamibacteria bacterium]